MARRPFRPYPAPCLHCRYRPARRHSQFPNLATGYCSEECDMNAHKQAQRKAAGPGRPDAKANTVRALVGLRVRPGRLSRLDLLAVIAALEELAELRALRDLVDADAARRCRGCGVPFRPRRPDQTYHDHHCQDRSRKRARKARQQADHG